MPDETNLASPADLAGRLGQATLTDAQAAQAAVLLPIVSGLIRNAVDRDGDWDPDGTTATVLRAVCIEAAVRVINNPQGVRSHSEQLGQHQHSESFADATITGAALTDAEILLCRRAVRGKLTGSSRPRSVLTDAVRAGYYDRDRVEGCE